MNRRAFLGLPAALLAPPIPREPFRYEFRCIGAEETARAFENVVIQTGAVFKINGGYVNGLGEPIAFPGGPRLVDCCSIELDP